MLEKLLRFDRVVLGRFEKFSHWCQRTLGIISFVFSRLSLVVAILTLSIKFWFALVYYQNNFLAFTHIMMLYFCYVFWKHCGIIEDEFWRNNKVVGPITAFYRTPVSALVRVYFLADVFLRLIFLPGIMLNVKSTEFAFYFADFIFPLAMVCFFYFILVRPLPPGELRVLKPSFQEL